MNNYFSKSKVTNLRGQSNGLLFFKITVGARLQVFKKTGGGQGPPPAPMDGTPMLTAVKFVKIQL